MYRFILHHRKKVDAEYLQLFSHVSWDNKANTYDTIVKKYSELSFLNNIKYKDLFVMPFDKLVGIYYDYIAVADKISVTDVQTLHECFPYDNHSSDKIMPFIERHTQHTEATTCPYCDCRGIQIFQRRDTRRNYHLDHDLDKGRCPLVAMSLYNLLPVCPDCNTEKGANTFGNDKESTIMLSPFSSKYDFENQVPITVLPKNKKDILKIRSFVALKKYVITLDFRQAPIYEQEVQITKIRERFYSDLTSSEHSAMMEIYRHIVDRNHIYSKLDEMSRTESLSSDFYLPSKSKHKKGIRRLYDKFIRDTIKQYTK